MEEKIKVLGIEMDCLTAKDAMKRAIQFLEGSLLESIGIIPMDMLLAGQEDSEWRERVGQLQMILPGEKEILEAAGIEDRQILRETEERTFLRMFMKYLQKNHRRVYLLAETDEELTRVEDAVRRHNRGIRITGHALIRPGENREENVINEINGTETDCILSVLSSPYQEEFAARGRALLNVKVWMGCGSALWRSYDESKMSVRIRRLFLKKIFRHRVERQQMGK